jgi:7-cyano-7-deazaguanine synthase
MHVPYRANPFVTTAEPESPQSLPLGVLLSGGLDSSILLATLLQCGRPVRPFYIRTDVVWAAAELCAIGRFLAAVDSPRLDDLVVFDLPLSDLYQNHWSITGINVPGDTTPDEAVFLPGRNALLAIKPLIWCQQNGINELALAVLQGNPFADAQPEFFAAFGAAMTHGGGAPVRVIRPFAGMSKADVLALGRDLPLVHTFSCIAPQKGLHCGRCNKCGERRQAFASLGLTDPTTYSAAAADSNCAA